MQNEEGRDQRSEIRILHSAFCLSSSGQALIESCIVIALICLILAGFFQLSQIYSSKIVALHACARGARAKTVGFNQSMVSKVVRTAAIGNAGKMTYPETSGGPLGQMAVERGRIPLYLDADGSLQYEDWDTISHTFIDTGGSMLEFTVSQDLPLRYFTPIFSAFYATNAFPIETSLRLDNHAALYLE